MKKGMWLKGTTLCMILLVCCGFSALAATKEVPRITKEELKKELGKQDVVVIDVRTGSDWSSSDRKIEGAIREDPKKVKEWAPKYDKEKTIVLYCA